jgi:hypothetical protein
MIQLVADPRVVASWGILFVGIACMLLALTGMANTFDPARVREREARAQLVKNAIAMNGASNGTPATFSHAAFTAVATLDDETPRVEYYFKRRCRKCLHTKPTWEAFYADLQINPIRSVVAVSVDGAKLTDAEINALSFTDLPSIVYRAKKGAEPSVYKGAVDVVALRAWVVAQKE